MDNQVILEHFVDSNIKYIARRVCYVGGDQTGDIITELYTVDHLSVQYSLGNVSYTIDRLENFNTKFISNSSVSNCLETEVTHIFGRDEDPDKIEISSVVGQRTRSTQALKLNIHGIILYIVPSEHVIKDGKNTAYILYKGNVDEPTRIKIRDCISFSLGNFLIYLGSAFLNEKFISVGEEVKNPQDIPEIEKYPPMPPAPLVHVKTVMFDEVGDTHILTSGRDYIDQNILSLMVVSIFDRYDELDFGDFSWRYWYSVASPEHMGGVYFGSCTESFQRGFREKNQELFQENKTTFLSTEDWKPVSDTIRNIIDNVSQLSLDDKTKLKNKIGSLNSSKELDPRKHFYESINLCLSEVEKKAWMTRHISAHGTRTDIDDMQIVINIRLLWILLNRTILKITNANQYYFDYSSVGFPVRLVSEPSQANRDETKAKMLR